MRMNRKVSIEITLVLVLCVVLFSFLASITPRESDSDILSYMNMGYNNVPNLRWMTRYGHVYPLKAFLSISEDPFQGGLLFWAFLMTATTGLIYVIARTILASSTYVHGILAAGIFLSFYIHPERTGQAWADFTAMFVLVLLISVFLISARQRHQKRWVLFAMGLIFFWAFETKETIWVSSLLLVDLAVDEENKLDPKLFWTRFKQVLPGAAAGLILFMILNGIFLKDIFFSIRPGQLKTFLSYWMNQEVHFSKGRNWYQSVIFYNFPIPFILFIASVLKASKKNFPVSVRLVAAIPLVLILLLTIGQIKSNFSVADRFFLPGIAVVCIFAPQFIKFTPLESNRQRGIFWLTILAAGIGFHLYVTGIRIFTTVNEINFPEFIRHVHTPLFFTALLLLILFFNKYSFSTVFIPSYVLIAIFLFPLKTNYRNFLNPTPNSTIQKRFYLFETFGEHIQASQDMLLYVSADIPEQFKVGTANAEVLFPVFDLHFSTHSKWENFTSNPDAEEMYANIINEEFTYVFLTQENWKALADTPEHEAELLGVCQYFEDTERPIVFLDCR